MRWAIKHKSGRTLFVTSDEFIANNRRKMGWIVEEVKMTSRERFEAVMSDKYEWFSDAIACADFCGNDDDGYMLAVIISIMGNHVQRLCSGYGEDGRHHV